MQPDAALEQRPQKIPLARKKSQPRFRIGRDLDVWVAEQAMFAEILPAAAGQDEQVIGRTAFENAGQLGVELPHRRGISPLKIREGDEQAMIYYIQEIQKQNCYPGGICSVTPQSAKQMVRNRAQQIVAESAPSTDDTLRLLEGLMRTAAQIPGGPIELPETVQDRSLDSMFGVAGESNLLARVEFLGRVEQSRIPVNVPGQAVGRGHIEQGDVHVTPMGIGTQQQRFVVGRKR